MSLADMIRQGTAEDVRPQASNVLATATLGAPQQATPESVFKQAMGDSRAQAGLGQLAVSLLSGQGLGRSLGQGGEAIGRVVEKEQEAEDRVTEAEQLEFENNLATRKVDLSETDMKLRSRIAAGAASSRARNASLAERRFNASEDQRGIENTRADTAAEVTREAGESLSAYRDRTATLQETTAETSEARKVREENINSETNIRKNLTDNMPTKLGEDGFTMVPSLNTGEVGQISAIAAELAKEGQDHNAFIANAVNGPEAAIEAYEQYKAARDAEGKPEEPSTTPEPQASELTNDVSEIVTTDTSDSAIKSLIILEKSNLSNAELVDFVRNNPQQAQDLLAYPGYPSGRGGEALASIKRRIRMAIVAAGK